jgi:hypothetical protein
MKAISYSLFGYDRERHKDSFEFNTYIRGLWLNFRMNRLLYPNWDMVVWIDSPTYNSPFKPLIDAMGAEIRLMPDNLPHCKAMIYRLATCYEMEKGAWKYSHVIMRDSDSLPTYREAQAVQVWINENTGLHSITDSISHTIPMMGGMIGLKPGDFSFVTSTNDFNALIQKSKDIDWSVKGADQDFMQRYLWPLYDKVGASNYTAHWIKGRVGCNLNHQYNYIQDVEVEGVPSEYKELDGSAFHIGASGWNDSNTLKWLDKVEGLDKYKDIEKDFTKICYWI